MRSMLLPPPLSRARHEAHEEHARELLSSIDEVLAAIDEELGDAPPSAD